MQAQDKIQVVIWDEQQPEQRQVYPNFLGNELADALAQHERLEVTAVKMDDPDMGLSKVMDESCDVMIWWGHRRHDEIPPEIGIEIMEKVKAGKMDFIALHSAHFSTPFMECMAEVTRQQVEATYQPSPEKNIEVEYLPYRRYAPKDELAMAIEPWVRPYKYPDGSVNLIVQLPNCCFPAWRVDGKPSYFKTLLPDHPIAQDIPEAFSLPETEMYSEPFHVPEPDEVVFEEYWNTGEWFRSGSVWTLGKGKVFYFRPGHETYDIFARKIPIKIIENAVLWLGGE